MMLEQHLRYQQFVQQITTHNFQLTSLFGCTTSIIFTLREVNDH